MTLAIVLDVEVLARLAQDLEDREFTSAFARRYCGMLTSRIERITTAVLDADLATALDSTLSLKVSSTSVGTHELAHIAHTIEIDLRAHDLERAHAKTHLLRPAARRAEEALTAYLST